MWRSIKQPISDRSLSGALIALRHGNPCPQVPQRHPRAIPAPSPRHPSAIPVPSQRGETITQPISKRFLSGVITGLRHGHPAQRYLRAILAWQSVLLSGIRHDKLVHRYLRGIILWRSQTGHLPMLVHEIGLFHGHRGLDRVLIHEIGLFHGH